MIIRKILVEDVGDDLKKGIVNDKKSLKSISGIIEMDYRTDSVKLKKED